MHYILYTSVPFFNISPFAKSDGVGITAGSQIASVSGITAAAKDSTDRIESAVSGVVSAVSGVVSAVSGVVSAVSTLATSARIAGHNVSRVVSAVSRVVSTVSTISSQTGVVVIPIIVSTISIMVSVVVSAALVAVGLGGGAGLEGPELVEPGGGLEVGAGAAVLHVAPHGPLVRRFAVSVYAAVFVLEGGDVALAAAVGTPGRSPQPNILLLGRFLGQTSPNAHSQNEKLHFFFSRDILAVFSGRHQFLLIPM